MRTKNINSTKLDVAVSLDSLEGKLVSNMKPFMYSTHESNKAMVIRRVISTKKGQRAIFYYLEPGQQFLVRTSQKKAVDLFRAYQRSLTDSSKLIENLQKEKLQVANLTQELHRLHEELSEKNLENARLELTVNSLSTGLKISEQTRSELEQTKSELERTNSTLRQTLRNSDEQLKITEQTKNELERTNSTLRQKLTNSIAAFKTLLTQRSQFEDKIKQQAQLIDTYEALFDEL